jgi:class 3 adenylate cyclase
MMDVPEVHYARSGGVSIAYQVFGSGPVDLVVVRGSLSDLGSVWEQPLFVRHAEGLARFARVLMFDKRGMGLSDRLRDVSTIEDRMDDIRAVLDDTRIDRAAFFAAHEGTRLALLFGSSYPERTRALVLYEPSVRGRRSPDYPWARNDDEWRDWLREVAAGWGDAAFFGRMLREYSPSVAGDPEFTGWYVRHMRSSASPSAAVAFQRMVMDGDVSSVLPTIRVPTLVLHRSMSLGPADYVARRIPGAQRVEIPALKDGFSWANPEANQILLDATARFLVGLDSGTERESVLGTFLFTDIVESTARAAEVGNVAWQALLEQHHAIVRHRLAQFRGDEVGTAGDGFFATFDGPGRAIRCACTIRDDVRALGLEIRAGVHSGEGQVIDGQVGGLAVHIAARVAAQADPGEVLVSSTVRDLVAGSGFEFEDRGVHGLKGVPGEWRLYSVCADASRSGGTGAITPSAQRPMA